jgi:hypothetical protein
MIPVKIARKEGTGIVTAAAIYRGMQSYEGLKTVKDIF